MSHSLLSPAAGTDAADPGLLTVAQRRVVAGDVVELELARPDGGPLPAWTPGAHVDLVLGPDLVRQYSLCGDPGRRDRWRIAVLRDPGGRGGSRLVHESLTVGTTVGVRGPRNHFALVRAARYLFVAGGIGITPILPMIAEAAAAGADWRLLYGGRTESSMAYRDELLRHGARVTLCPQDRAGLLDLPGALRDVPPDTRVYCCGPEPLLAAAERACADRTAGLLHVERFASRALDAEPDTPFEVVLERSGRSVAVPPGTSVLDAVEAAGAEVLQSCREGTCGSCETTVLDGEPDHRDSVLDEVDRASGDVMMICVSRARGPRLVLDL